MQPQSYSEAQQQALQRIRRYINWFLTNKTKSNPTREDNLRTAKVTYTGEDIKTAVPLTWAQVQAALPPKGQAAVLRASEICEGWLAEVLEDPTQIIRPRSEWPETLPSPKVRVKSDHEWHKIVRGCLDLGIWGCLKREDLIVHNGKPLLLGAFGIEKPKQRRPETNLPAQRLIVNAPATNAVQYMILGDIRKLPYHHQYQSLQILDDESVLLFSVEDLTSAFNIFLLGNEWMPYQAFSKPVPGHVVQEFRPDLKDVAEVFLAPRVIMMGWQAATGIMQALHRQMMLLSPPAGAGLPPETEIRRDRPFPHYHYPEKSEPTRSQRVAKSIALIYLDGFTEAEKFYWNTIISQSPSFYQSQI